MGPQDNDNLSNAETTILSDDDSEGPYSPRQPSPEPQRNPNPELPRLRRGYAGVRIRAEEKEEKCPEFKR